MDQTDQIPPEDAEGAPRPKVPAWHQWWPLLLGPAMVAVIYLYDPHGEKLLFSRYYQDDIGVPYAITLAAMIVAFGRAAKERNLLMALLGAMALAIYYRELHWAWSSKIAYATLIGTILIGRHWYAKVGPFLCRGRVAQWLIMTAAAYVFAVAVAKGWIKPLLPNNDVLRDFYEETCENLAHAMLLFTALFTGRKRL